LASTDNLSKRQNTYKRKPNIKSGPYKQQKTYSQKNNAKRETGWTQPGLQHAARKWSGSILSTPEPARGSQVMDL